MECCEAVSGRERRPRNPGYKGVNEMANVTYADARDELQRARWASIANIVAGLWMIAAPFVLNFENDNFAQWNHVIVGAAVALIALVRASDPDHRVSMSWTNVVLGVWMIAAPFVLGYSDVNDAQTNSIIMGAVVIALGAFSAYETNQAHREATEVDRGRRT